MESKPIEVIPEDNDEAKDKQADAGDSKLAQMEFDTEQLLQVQKSEIDHDQELLQIQRRKSTPKVVVEEFVQVDSDDDQDGETQPKKEESKQSEVEDELFGNGGS